MTFTDNLVLPVSTERRTFAADKNVLKIESHERPYPLRCFPVADAAGDVGFCSVYAGRKGRR